MINGNDYKPKPPSKPKVTLPRNQQLVRRVIKFKRWSCLLRWGYYASNTRPSIELIDALDGDLIATATVNIVEVPLEPNEVIIKDYSENEGMLRALLDHGVLKETGKEVQGPYVRLPICELLVPWGTI